MPPTIGVEEEFLLSDPLDGTPLPLASRILGEAVVPARTAPGAAFHPELSAAVVEAASGVCETLADLRAQLLELRASLVRYAYEEGAALLSTGNPVRGDGDTENSAGGRFDRITSLYRDVLSGYECCACQVHVRVPDRDTAVAVINRVRSWLPALLAVSANSPMSAGRDTGYGSWRMVRQARLPGSGLPPVACSAAEYDELVAGLVTAGVLVDDAMTFWLARPSPRHPTVEFRAADAVGSVDEAVLQAGLSRALVLTAQRSPEAFPANPVVAPGLEAAAVWTAARYGLTGDLLHPYTTKRKPAEALLRELLGLLAPALRAVGDERTVLEALNRVTADGPGAEHQRRALRAGGPDAVVRMLADRTAGVTKVESWRCP